MKIDLLATENGDKERETRGGRSADEKRQRVGRHDVENADAIDIRGRGRSQALFAFRPVAGETPNPYEIRHGQDNERREQEKRADRAIFGEKRCEVVAAAPVAAIGVADGGPIRLAEILREARFESVAGRADAADGVVAEHPPGRTGHGLAFRNLLLGPPRTFEYLLRAVVEPVVRVGDEVEESGDGAYNDDGGHRGKAKFAGGGHENEDERVDSDNQQRRAKRDNRNAGKGEERRDHVDEKRDKEKTKIELAAFLVFVLYHLHEEETESGAGIHEEESACLGLRGESRKSFGRRQLHANGVKRRRKSVCDKAVETENRGDGKNEFDGKTPTALAQGIAERKNGKRHRDEQEEGLRGEQHVQTGREAADYARRIFPGPQRADIDKLARSVQRLDDGKGESQEGEDEEDIVLHGFDGAGTRIVGTLALFRGREEQHYHHQPKREENERQIGCDILRTGLHPSKKTGDDRQVQRDYYLGEEKGTHGRFEISDLRFEI